jgi:hypothetical protein
LQIFQAEFSLDGEQCRSSIRGRLSGLHGVRARFSLELYSHANGCREEQCNKLRAPGFTATYPGMMSHEISTVFNNRVSAPVSDRGYCQSNIVWNKGCGRALLKDFKFGLTSNFFHASLGLLPGSLDAFANLCRRSDEIVKYSDGLSDIPTTFNFWKFLRNISR